MATGFAGIRARAKNNLSYLKKGVDKQKSL